jgi:hypothetical protein
MSYLADDIAKVCIPMGILHDVCGSTKPFCWSYLEQRAFDEIKEYALACETNCCVTLDYNPNAEHINMITDGCSTSVAGAINQGDDWT